MSTRILSYTFVLIAIFLVLSRFGAANTLLQSGFKGYGTAIGLLQGRDVDRFGAVTGIAR